MPNFNNGRDVQKWFEAKVKELTNESKDVIRNGIRDGETKTKEYISTRGTEKSGKAGRIETRRMLNAVGSEIRKDNADEFEGAFGWVGDRAMYFWYQEQGFFNVSAGVTVEGMYALTDAAAEVIQDVNRKISQVVRSV